MQTNISALKVHLDERCIRKTKIFDVNEFCRDIGGPPLIHMTIVVDYVPPNSVYTDRRIFCLIVMHCHIACSRIQESE